MVAPVLILLCACGTVLVAAARRPRSHAAALERLGGMMLVAGLVGLGFALARSGG